MVKLEGEQWTIVRLAERLYAFPSGSVAEMLAMPSVRTLPRTPEWIRGLINLRGSVLPLVDLRSRLGLPSSSAETTALLEMLQQRQQDHCRWVGQLKIAIQEDKEFTLTTDPHKCAFGRWYDTYTTSNHMMALVLRKFDEPHRRIHHGGAKVLEHRARGEKQAMTALLDVIERRDLPAMIRLFDDFAASIRESHRETAVVLSDGRRRCSVSVDKIESVELLRPETYVPLPAIVGDVGEGFLSGVARRVRSDEMVIVLDGTKLLAESAAVA
jgi:chemotaxis signal transduction protein